LRSQVDIDASFLGAGLRRRSAGGACQSGDRQRATRLEVGCRAMRLLVLAPRAVDAGDVRTALGDDVEGAEVRVVSPALHESGIAFWMSDSDEAIADAEEAQRETVEALRAEGAEASGGAGESDPLQALEDALATFPADRVLVFVTEGEDEQRYREEDLADADERLGIPVTVATL
jgi:hypothetical protein